MHFHSLLFFLRNLLLFFLNFFYRLFGGGDSKDEKKRGVAILFLLFSVISFVAVLFSHKYVSDGKRSELSDPEDVPLSKDQ